MADSRTALHILAALRRSPVGDAAVLVGSSGHKGAKDKIQALLVVAEHEGETRFEKEVLRLLKDVDPVRLDDVRVGAQNAFLALERDPMFADTGAEGYVPVLRQVETGLSRLLALLERLHA